MVCLLKMITELCATLGSVSLQQACMVLKRDDTILMFDLLYKMNQKSIML